jgi:hypothetical protein
MEKISSAGKSIVEDEKPEDKKAKKYPSNVATGLLQGAGAVIKGVLGAVIGFFLDPIIGGKKQGFKGAIKGFGRGLLGLIIRPVAGTLDLVTLTVRGIANTPKTIYIKLNTVLKKKRLPKGIVPVAPYLEVEQVHRACVMPIVEDNVEYDLCLDEEELRRQLIQEFNKEEPVLSEKSDEGVTENINQVMMADIKKKQKKQKKEKKCKMLKIKKELKHFKENLEKALNNMKIEEDTDTLMREKAKKSIERIIGAYELDYEGLPTLIFITSNNNQNEKTDADNLDEFNREEGVHFQETFKEFQVECNLVTIGVDSEEGAQEIVEECLRTHDKLNNRSFAYPSGTQSLTALPKNIEKYRKNPMHRAPPCILIILTLGMHNHHIKNPLFRTFTEEENKKIEDELQKEVQQELIQERLSLYQAIGIKKEESKNTQSQVQM